MFDIYSLAKPRVFKMKPVDGGGTQDTDDTPGETPAPDSVFVEAVALQNTVKIVDAEKAEEIGHPEAEGRMTASLVNAFPSTNNLINTVSDLGGKVMEMKNYQSTYYDEALKHKVFRTEFRPKQGLHNLDFTTPAETPSDNPGGDAPAQ